jgi:periplasmic protein TonB
VRVTDADVLFLSQRRFVQALAVSFVCHILVLSLLPGLRSTSSRLPPPQPLQARLLPPPPRHIPVPEPPLISKPPPVAEKPLHRPSRQAERPILMARSKTQPSPARAEPAVPPPPPTRFEPAPASAPMPIAVPQTAPPERASPAPEPEPHELMLSGYVRELERALAANQEYPRAARLRGWQGSVKMRVQFLPGGQLGQVSILRSSGFALLDQTALEMVRRAELPPAPDSLHHREFTVDVPVMFRLRG